MDDATQGSADGPARPAEDRDGFPPGQVIPLVLVGSASEVGPLDKPHAEALRIVTYLMLVRTTLATVLMLSVVVLAWTLGSPETLASPFGRFVFGLLATTYLASLVNLIVQPFSTL